MKRIVFRIQFKPIKASGRKWAVYEGRRLVRRHYLQESSVAFATFEANQFWRNLNHPAQVVLHGKDGRIRWERTYGRDPKRRKG